MELMEINNVDTAVKLNDSIGRDGHKYAFRGHSCTCYELIPEIGRGTAYKVVNEEECLKEFQQKILDIVFGLGGTITAEHGIGLWKQQFLVQELGEETMDTMKLIKKSLDPNNILNPDKTLPIRK